MKRQYTLAETFVGAGGSHQGFKLTGFKTIFASDIDKEMMQTLQYNNPEIPSAALLTADIRAVNGADILKNSKLEKGQLDVLFGGVVCKGFSLAGVRDPTDPRNNLYKEQLRLVKELLPKISVIENVPAMASMQIAKASFSLKKKERLSEIFNSLKLYNGLKSSKTKKGEKLSLSNIQHIKQLKQERDELLIDLGNNSVKVFEDIKKIYDELGYNTKIKKLNSVEFGAATKRERIFIVSTRRDLASEFNWPKITHGDSNKPFTTINDSLSKLELKGINDPTLDIDNQPMRHTEKSIRRFKFIPEGKNIASVMDLLPEDLRISKFYSRGCTMRLNGSTPAPTLVPGHSNFPVHPIEHRSITVREAATITGFPINYKFFGTHTNRCMQVGNAVPVKLAKAIAKQCKEFLDSLEVT